MRAEIPAETSTETRGLLAELSAEEKAEQLVIAGVDPGDLDQLPSSGAWLVDELSWRNPVQGRRLMARLRRRTDEGRIPKLLVTRQEGGEHRALAGLPPELRAIEIGDIGTTEAARAWAEIAAEAIAAEGFDLNLAPVADIGTLDSPINDRSFSDDPQLVAALVAAAMRGCTNEGIVCAPAHFPGLGGASQDTDTGPASVSIDEATILNRELAPFRAAFAVDDSAVVVSNAFYAAFDPVVPASLSSEVLGGLLRDELGFRGVAITDDLGAGSIRSQTTPAEAAVRAIRNGADMVQVADPDQAGAVVAALRVAAGEGAIPEDRLNQATARVLELKRKAGVFAEVG